ncbi:nitroreductase family protein [Chloroflexota bacterium]
MANGTEYDCLLNLVKKRRSTRQFLSNPVPNEYITKIVETARWAPSAFHTQPWEFMVVNDEELKNKIVTVFERLAPPIKDPAKGSLETKSFKDAPVYIFLLCDWRAKIGLPGQTSENIDRVTSLFNSSMANAFLFMHLAAASLGLASQWYTAGSRPEVENALKEVVGIPEYFTIYDMMVIGYEAAPPNTKIVRDTDEMVHYNYCKSQEFRTDQEVVAYAEKTKAWCISEH